MEREGERERDYDVDKMSFFNPGLYSTFKESEIDPVFSENGVARPTLRAKLPINKAIICVIMCRLQLMSLMHCFSHVRPADQKES